MTTDGDQVTKIQGDPDHPLSTGYLCPKGAAMVDVQNDPDRVLQPMRRIGAPGEFEPVSWETSPSPMAGATTAAGDTPTPRAEPT